MVDQSLSLLELLLLSSLLTGSFGAKVTHVFGISGENVSLSCDKDLNHCRSTTWLYSSSRSGTVGLIEKGENKKNTERHERLSLDSDCSLNIRNITTQESGLYKCRQYENGQPQDGSETSVFLHVVEVSSQISSDSLTLYCRIYTDDLFSLIDDPVSCDSHHSVGLHLSWVDQSGAELQSDSRSQIFSSDCIISLRTTLLNEEDSRDWRCQIKLRDQVQKTVRYTLQKQAQETTTASKNSQDPSTTHTDLSEGSEQRFCLPG